MKLLTSLVALVLLSALPARGQARGGSVSYGSSIDPVSSTFIPFTSASHLPPSPLTRFRVVALSGSTDFVPSSFVSYEQAVASGSEQTHDVYVSYDQAMAQGISKLAKKPTSLALAVRSNQAHVESKTQATFVQDDQGRIVRQSN